MSDAADKAHQAKEEQAGFRLVPHATTTDEDRELRAIQDEAEVERKAAFEESGYIAAPGVGDYNAVRREAKQMGGLLSGSEPGEAVGAVLPAVRRNLGEATKEAAQARKAAGERRDAEPTSRRSRAEVAQGQTGSASKPSGSGASSSSTQKS
jgi:hypothetical protein